MKKVIGYYHISTNNVDNFHEQFQEKIQLLQNDNQEVEVQYNTQVINNPENPILYSALLVGRKESL